MRAKVTARNGPRGMLTLVVSMLNMGMEKHGRTSVGRATHLPPGPPKTRSGKTMRRILRKIARGETDDLGDTSTLADPSIVAALIETMPR